MLTSNVDAPVSVATAPIISVQQIQFKGNGHKVSRGCGLEDQKCAVMP